MDNRSTTEVSVKDFIQRVLIRDIGKMICDCKLHYLSFAVMAQAIEFLGACLDEEAWDKPNQSEKRFNSAVKKLFKASSKEYTKYTSSSSDHYLYEGLRCGLIHMMRPRRKVFLTHRAESKRENTSHLGKTDGKLILVAEDLYDDVKRACEKVIQRIDQNKITNKKVNDSYLRIIDWSRQNEAQVIASSRPTAEGGGRLMPGG